MKLPTDLYASVLGVNTSFRSFTYPPIVANVLVNPAGTAEMNEYSLVLMSGAWSITPSAPVVSTRTFISRVSFPRRIMALTVSPLCEMRTGLASWTNSDPAMEIILSPPIRPLPAFGEVPMTSLTINGLARSNIPGVFRTFPSMLWSIYMSRVSLPRRTVAFLAVRLARSAWSMPKSSGT